MTSQVWLACLSWRGTAYLPGRPEPAALVVELPPQPPQLALSQSLVYHPLDVPTENSVFDLLQAEAECPSFHAHLPSLSPPSPGPQFSVMRPPVPAQCWPSPGDMAPLPGSFPSPAQCGQNMASAAAPVLTNTLQTQAAFFPIRICLARVLQAVM